MTAQSPQPISERATVRRWVPVALMALGIICVVVGIVLWVIARSQASFGWFAYAPLSSTTFVGSPSGFDPVLRSLVVLGIGLVLVAFGGGWLIGRRGH